MGHVEMETEENKTLHEEQACEAREGPSRRCTIPLFGSMEPHGDTQPPSVFECHSPPRNALESI
jgi:hypothetical protein